MGSAERCRPTEPHVISGRGGRFAIDVRAAPPPSLVDSANHWQLRHTLFRIAIPFVHIYRSIGGRGCSWPQHQWSPAARPLIQADPIPPGPSSSKLHGSPRDQGDKTQ